MVIEEISIDQYVDAVSSSNVESTLDLGSVLIVHTNSKEAGSMLLINGANGRHAKIQCR